MWKEVISVLNHKGTTYGVIVRIPSLEFEAKYQALYRQIRDSFHLTRP